jgi:hypothetical protein
MAKKPAKHAHATAHAKVTKAKKKHDMSTARYRAYIAYVDKHYPEKAKKPEKARKAIASRAGDAWILGQNDELETCSVTAIANSLRHALGVLTPDDEIASFGESLDIARAMRMVMMFGLAGQQLARASLVPFMRPGCVTGMMIPDGPHAALYLGHDTWASWGGAVQLDDGLVIEEIWQLDWR